MDVRRALRSDPLDIVRECKLYVHKSVSPLVKEIAKHSNNCFWYPITKIFKQQLSVIDRCAVELVTTAFQYTKWPETTPKKFYVETPMPLIIDEN